MTKELVSNRKAYHNYEIIESLEAGIILVGTEIKSLRDNGGSLQESYIIVSGEDVILKSCHIAPYQYGNIHNHEARRNRKLLLHKREIEKLRNCSTQKGLTLIPLSLYLKNGVCKVKLGVARGKQLHDKRASVKERESKRAIDRALKGD